MDKDNNMQHVPTPDNFLVVGIGASAGGIEAMQAFFEQVLPDKSAAYVVILHLSPNHDSQLSQVLQQVTTLPVQQVTARTHIEAGHIYVIPPDKHLTMEDGHIVPSPNMHIEDRRAPVDIFFRTLAEARGSRAVGVILSGTGANGSMGLKRIKERGGTVFAQNPREAIFNEMPRNAIATGMVDEVFNVAVIPGHIQAYHDMLETTHITEDPEKQEEEEQQALREIFTQLRLRTGHDFSNYKRATLIRRIHRRVAVRTLPGLAAYASYANEHPEETQALLKDLLISVTNFFRDKTPFDYLEKEIIPALFKDRNSDNEVRIWVAGCATGEEAYTLAILCAEHTLGMINAPRIQVFATDIDEAAITAAREGLYTLNDAADISAERLAHFFTKEGELYRIRREVRETVLFAYHNFLKDPPFSRIDLITCRNVLIYLSRTAQDRVMETFHFALRPDGYLMLGTSESVDTASDVFKSLNRDQHIYQPRHSLNQRPAIIPDSSQPLKFVQPASSVKPVMPAASAVRPAYGDLHIELLEEYAPPSVVVNAEFDIVHVSPRAGRYMQLSAGEPTQAILKFVREELRSELRNGLYQAAQQSVPVNGMALHVNTDQGTEHIRIHVRPIRSQDDNKRGFLLVVFEPVTDNALQQEAIVSTNDETAARHLEDEVARLRTHLRSSNEQHEFQAEELKAGNEELQAMNEELRSATEELETSKEELQSINEELSTVNQELKVKVEEATITSSNLQNLINSTDIGTIFLDRSLRVVLFTPAIRLVFNLIPADYGRPLSDITSKLSEESLLEDAQAVLERLQLIEREVQTKDGKTFLARLSPYRTEEDRIQGVVLSLVDITERKRSEEARFFLAAIVASWEDAVISVNFKGIITSWNAAAENLYGYASEQALGQPLTMLALPKDLTDVLKNAEKVKQTQNVEVYDTIRINKDGREMHLEVVLSPVKDDLGTLIGVSAVARDVTERRMESEALRVSEERMRLIIESAKDYAIFMLDNNRHVSSWNTGAQAMFGYAEDEILGEPADILFTLEDCKRGEPEREEKIARETGRAISERWHIRKDGSRFWGSGLVNPLLNQGGDQIGFVKIMRDLTDQRHAEQALRESEERKEFLLKLNDTIRQLNDPGKIQYEAARLVAEQLEADRVHFAEITDDEGLVIRKDYVRGDAPPVVEAFEAAAIAAAIKLDRDEPVVIPDTRTFPLLSDEDKAAFAAAKIRSQLSVAFSKKGKKVASFGADQMTAREWRPLEVSIMQEAAERTLIAVEKARAELALRMNEERQAFLLRLSDALRPLGDTAAIEREACRLLGEHLQAEHTYYAEIDADMSSGVVRYDYVRNGPIPFIAEYRVPVLGFVIPLYQRGEPVVVNDVFTSPLIPDADRASAAAFHMSWIAVPIVKDGLLAGSFCTAMSTPRQWNQWEVELTRETAERVWAAIERARSDEALHMYEERYRVALQSAEMGAWDWNVQEDKISWNDQHFLLLGLQPEDRKLNASFFLQFVHPDDIDAVGNELRQAVEETGSYRMEAFRIIRGNGEVRWMSGYGQSVAWVNGRCMRMVGVMYDITERKLLEQQKEQFTGIASHELRTPVTSIKAYAEILEEIFLENGDTKSAGLMQKMDVQVDRLTSLISALLDTTRINEGKLQLEKAGFKMDELITDTVETMQRIAGKQRIELQLDASVTVNADRERIRQVLTNLISNALKYSPGAKRIVVKSTASEKELTVSVQDFGIGISEEAQPQLFSRFFREKETNPISGLGLGLFISASIIKEHGGTIRVKSRKGKGSVFYFTLPLAG